MSNNTAIYPGTFDPITNGHLDIITRGAQLFDQLIIGVANSNSKTPLFSLGQRLELIREATAALDNVSVKGFDKLLVDFANLEKANVILRGLRTQSDFDIEFRMAGMNQALDQHIETVFLASAHDNTFISSTLIREIATMGGDVTRFVPECVLRELRLNSKDKLGA